MHGEGVKSIGIRKWMGSSTFPNDGHKEESRTEYRDIGAKVKAL